jgi:crossover junction endodeoxyribonuclease RuvC
LPFPTTAFFTSRAAYSPTSIPARAAIIRTTPRAWPSFRVDWGFLFFFYNTNPKSPITRALARGVFILIPARAGLEVGEYAARLVKKAVVGTGGAEKAQVHAMVARLLPGAKIAGPDAADALAVAITHAHHLATSRRIS